MFGKEYQTFEEGLCQFIDSSFFTLLLVADEVKLYIFYFLSSYTNTRLPELTIRVSIKCFLGNLHQITSDRKFLNLKIRIFECFVHEQVCLNKISDHLTCEQSNRQMLHTYTVWADWHSVYRASYIIRKLTIVLRSWDRVCLLLASVAEKKYIC